MASEYGWSDEYIGNIPLVRFRQITAAIQTRRYANQRDESARFSWLARQITVFIAQGYMVDAGENKALELARTLAFDDVEAAFLGAAAEEPKAKENSPGSYERLMSGFAQLEARGKTL